MVRPFDTPLQRILVEEFRSQAALARALGMDRRRMHLIVHGLVPTQDEALAIAHALGRGDDVASVFPHLADTGAAA